MTAEYDLQPSDFVAQVKKAMRAAADEETKREAGDEEASNSGEEDGDAGLTWLYGMSGGNTISVDETPIIKKVDDWLSEPVGPHSYDLAKELLKNEEKWNIWGCLCGDLLPEIQLHSLERPEEYLMLYD